MEKYFVIVRVNNQDYMVKIESSSMGGAENVILSHSFAGIDEYSIQAAQAFDRNGMKTDFFAEAAMNADPISYAELLNIVDENSKRIRAKDELTKKKRELDRLAKQYEALKAEIEEAENHIA